MFRPIRTLFLMMLMFLTGIFYERYQHGIQCSEAGGRIIDEFCVGANK